MNDDDFCIANKRIEKDPPKDWEFAAGDVICLDMYASTGNGQSVPAKCKVTIYKKTDQQKVLTSKSARQVYSVASKKNQNFPFSLRCFEDCASTNVGVNECLDKELLSQYPVMMVEPNESVAQFKCTVVVQPRSTAIIAGGKDLSDELISEYSIQDQELKKIIDGELWSKGPKKEKKKKTSEKESEKKML